ncbi:MAG: hypothetical protein ABJG68_03350 [Crocinitomicaceae bacterium]
MKRLALILTILFSTTVFSQKEVKWDVQIGAMESDSQGFNYTYVPNAIMFFGVLGMGEWEINTGSRGFIYLSDIKPEIQIAFPANIYLGFQHSNDSLDYWQETCQANRYKELYLLADSSMRRELQYSVTFEKNSNVIKNIEDIQGIIHYLKKDTTNAIVISSGFIVDGDWQHEDIYFNKAKIVKKEILRLLPSSKNRIELTHNVIQSKYFDIDVLPIEFTKVRNQRYLYSEHTIICEEPANLVFEPLSKRIDEKNAKIIENLAEFMLQNKSLGVELRLYKSDKIPEELANQRAESFFKLMINKGLRSERFSSKILTYPTKKKVDSLLSNNEFVPNPDEATFYVLDETPPPCLLSGHPKIHFKNNTQEIFESECDSLIHLVELINSDSTTNYYCIGIATDKSPEEKSRAISRAEIVKSKLIQMGVNANRLTTTQSYHKPTSDEQPKNWPFYPNWYEFEIGVYLEINH